MSDEPMRVTRDELAPEGDGRFDRFRLIGWWDQARLRQARGLVVGAGALGNELIKNLALLGWGNLLIADMDRIENSNLSRSVLYRARDNGRPKALAAAESAQDIYPAINAQAFDGNIVYDLGLGAFRWADVIFGGLDNREARLAINRNCWRLGRPWIDGAIEQIQGCARVFVPDGPCYECTMSERDWELLNRRRSCNLLTRDEMELGKTPTTPTIASIVAGVQCQEALKYIHGLETMRGCGWIFEGLSGDSYQIEYQRKEDCYSHEPLDNVVSLDRRSDEMTVGELVAEARAVLGPEAEVELARDVLEKLVCPRCGEEESMFVSLGGVGQEKAGCPDCAAAGHDVRREAVTFYKLREEERLAGRTLREVGVPPFDIVFARRGARLVGFELAGDAPDVLGTLVGTQDALEWT